MDRHETRAPVPQEMFLIFSCGSCIDSVGWHEQQVTSLRHCVTSPSQSRKRPKDNGLVPRICVVLDLWYPVHAETVARTSLSPTHSLHRPVLTDGWILLEQPPVAKLFKQFLAHRGIIIRPCPEPDESSPQTPLCSSKIYLRSGLLLTGPCINCFYQNSLCSHPLSEAFNAPLVGRPGNRGFDSRHAHLYRLLLCDCHKGGARWFPQLKQPGYEPDHNTWPWRGFCLVKHTLCDCDCDCSCCCSGYGGQQTCITYDAVNQAYIQARKRISKYQHYHARLCSALLGSSTTEITSKTARGSVLVKALRYKPEGRGFQTRWGEWISPIYLILPAALCPEADSTSHINEYLKQKNNVYGE
jgi:hypothetical protein